MFYKYLIDFMIKNIEFFTQAYEFFLFGSLMILDMCLLGWLAYHYKDVRTVHTEEIGCDSKPEVQ